MKPQQTNILDGGGKVERDGWGEGWEDREGGGEDILYIPYVTNS